MISCLQHIIMQKDKSGLKTKRYYFIVLGIILLEIIIMVQWCRVKDFYDGDEMFSYSLDNGNYTPFLRWNDDWWGKWHDVNYLTEQLTVDSNEAFNYKSVFYNQENDEHPPLFYCVLHTVCSVNQGVFSKWLGLSINLLFYGITLFLIWRITSTALNK